MHQTVRGCVRQVRQSEKEKKKLGFFRGVLFDMKLFFELENSDMQELAEERTKNKTESGHHGSGGNKGEESGEEFSESRVRRRIGRGPLASRDQTGKIKGINIRKAFDRVQSKSPDSQHSGRKKQGIKPAMKKGMIAMMCALHGLCPKSPFGN